MSETRVTRRLAAILAADVVGYSRLMGSDEAGTLSALKRHRQELFDPTVTLHSGRVFKLIGDGTLVEFASVVDAVNCALAIQRDVAASAAAGPRITLRIGINLGDIIVEGDDIYGDGVNVAARLEPLAEPGGVCVASIVAESVGARVDVRFADGGEVHVKNIERPIRVWRWHPAGGEAQASSTPAAAMAAPSPPKRPLPTIAVLPFSNMSGDAEQEYFSDGISEDIITDLSKVGGLLVIARNSSFAYKGKNVDIRTVGRELGAGVVLEGSIRRAANRVRITAQLIDAATGAHLWAERYDRELTDIFAVQDEVTGEIVKALKVTLTPQEQSRIAAAGTNSVEAHDLVLQAREIMTRSNKTRAGFERLLVLLDRALALDPNYSDAYACLGWAHQNDFQNRWSDDPDNAGTRALAYAERAIAADPGEPLGHYVASIVTMFGKDLDRSLAEAERALAVSPNYALALNARGAARVYLGDFQKGIPDIERAMRLDPGFSQQYLHFLGVAHFMLGQYETAAAHFRERVLLVPETDFSRAFLAATLGHLGRAEEARAVWQDLKRVNPRYVLAQHMERQPFRNPAHVARIVEGLAKAGLPD